MATVTGLTLTKTMNYRGDATETFSNTYWFKGPPPGNDASWEVLVNDVLTAEQKIFPASVSFYRALGYDSNDEHAQHVFSKFFASPGPAPSGIYVPNAATEINIAGDQAVMIEWATDRIGGRGKRTYLRKFFHEGFASLANTDNIGPDYVDYLIAVCDQLAEIHGGLRSQAHDLNTIANIVSPYVTTRTLKRRGKKKVT